MLPWESGICPACACWRMNTPWNMFDYLFIYCSLLALLIQIRHNSRIRLLDDSIIEDPLCYRLSLFTRNSIHSPIVLSDPTWILWLQWRYSKRTLYTSKLVLSERSETCADDSAPVSHTLNYLHRKYPNPFATHVHTVDTLSRHIDPDTGIIRSERIIGVQQGAPKWITKLFSLPPMAYVREIVFINPPGTGEDKTLPTSTSMSINLSLAQYV